MRVSHQHEGITVYFTEDEERSLFPRDTPVVMEHDFSNGVMLLQVGAFGPMVNRAAPQELEPWQVHFNYRDLEYTRFATVEVGVVGVLHETTITLPDIEDLPWPSYKRCQGYDLALELGLDYLLRARALGRAPKCGLDVPGIIRNYVRQGATLEALRRLKMEGRSFLLGKPEPYSNTACRETRGGAQA